MVEKVGPLDNVRVDMHASVSNSRPDDPPTEAKPRRPQQTLLPIPSDARGPIRAIILHPDPKCTDLELGEQALAAELGERLASGDALHELVQRHYVMRKGSLTQHTKT